MRNIYVLWSVGILLTVQVSLIMETEQACEVKLFQGNLTSTDGLSSACIP